MQGGIAKLRKSVSAGFARTDFLGQKTFGSKSFSRAFRIYTELTSR